MATEEITIDYEEPKVSQDFNIFVGAETGLLKGVCINPKLNLSKNFSNMNHLERKHEITAMSWGNDEQTEILLGLRGQVVRTFDSEDKSFTSHQDVTASGKIVGIARASDALIIASDSGSVQVHINKTFGNMYLSTYLCFPNLIFEPFFKEINGLE